jgi:hypothetical protein
MKRIINREARARQILENSKPECLDENTYLVPSQFDSTKKYQVTHFDSYSCNCKDFELRCKGKGIVFFTIDLRTRFVL